MNPGIILGGLVLVGLGVAYSQTAKADAKPGPAGPPGPGGGAPGPVGPALPKLTCDQALGALTPEWRTAIDNAVKLPVAERQAVLLALANQLAIAADATPVPGQVNVLRTAAECVRAAAVTGALPKGAPPPSDVPPVGKVPTGTPVDELGVPASWDGTAAIPGQQSNPAFQWIWLVKDPKSNSVLNIAFEIFGAPSELVLSRAVELVARNPTEHGTGRVLQVTGFPGTAAYGFSNLAAGDKLVLPATWNPWVDQTGKPRGQSTPWPAPLLKGGV